MGIGYLISIFIRNNPNIYIKTRKTSKLIVTLSLLVLNLLSTSMHALEIYAHRGIPSLLPETTIVGYEKSLEIGVNSLDIDVAITKDNIVVGSHDPYLNKDLTRDINGDWLISNNIKIIDLTFNQLQQYNIGAINPKASYSLKFPNQAKLNNITIPSLEQVINLLKSTGNKSHKIQIEVKTKPKYDSQEYIEQFTKAIIDVLVATNFVERAELQAFDWRILLYAKKINHKVKTAYITEQSGSLDTFKTTEWTAGYKLADYNNSIITMIAKLGGSIWCPYFKNVTRDLVNEAHANNLRVVPWTADTTEDMTALIDAGVDGIITNRADVLRDLMSELKMSLPPPGN